MSPADTAPGPVVLRGGRLLVLAALLAGVLVEAGIVAALVGVARRGSFVVGGVATSGRGTGLLVAVLVPIAVLVGLGLCALALSLVRPLTATVVGQDGILVRAGGRVRTRISLGDATRIAYRPAPPATGKAPPPGDPLVPGVRRSRSRASLEVHGAAGTVELCATRRWDEVVDVLRGWAAARPDLVSDTETAELLLGPAPDGHTRRWRSGPDG